jgi:hypothetical protein
MQLIMSLQEVNVYMTTPAKQSQSPFDFLTWLSMLIVLLALVAAGIGLFWCDRSQSLAFTTVQGQAVQLYGRGLYYYDTFF